jgi:hypothetical protein
MKLGKRLFLVWAIITVVLPVSIWAQDSLFEPAILTVTGLFRMANLPPV